MVMLMETPFTLEAGKVSPDSIIKTGSIYRTSDIPHFSIME